MIVTKTLQVLYKHVTLPEHKCDCDESIKQLVANMLTSLLAKTVGILTITWDIGRPVTQISDQSVATLSHNVLNQQRIDDKHLRQ